MTSPLAYLILNSLLLLFALRNFRSARSRIHHLITTPGSYRPWQPDHREAAQGYESARTMLLTMTAWLVLGQWVLLAAMLETGV